ncbi:SDR family oxidoreductase [Geminicoccaceae bacterium 1502E]|nr:SDR family oxidoreductase [Geminicoccaceae bacterium 1502E]
MQETVETFTVTSALVDGFARLTGDHNALHTDEEFARKSRFRQRVAHGMLAFARIGRLADAWPDRWLRFRTLEARFTNPVPVGAALRLEVRATPQTDRLWTFEACWTSEADGLAAITGSGSFALLPESPPPLLETVGQSCLLLEPVEEADRGADALAEATAELPLRITPGGLAALAGLIGGGGPAPALRCPNLAATMLLSTLVGMRLPGRRATFTDFRIGFEDDLPLDAPACLEGRVTKLSAASETLTAQARIACGGKEIATGEVRSVINPRPRAMLSAAEIRERHLGHGLEGKVVVVIGASRGIGETAAKLFAMAGARVVVHYFRGRSDAEAIAAEIAEAGGTALPLACDIRDEAEIGRFFAAVDSAFGGVDVLVNNAVMDFRPKPVSELRWPDYLGELEVSLKGLHACCDAAVSRFKSRGGGKIINVSSIAVDQPVRGQSKYITAKSAVVGYSKSLAVELLKDNVQVNLVVPAMTETDLLASIPSDFIRRMAKARGMGRNLQPIEVAQAMLYLASRWSDAITGQQIVLNLGEPPFA